MARKYSQPYGPQILKAIREDNISELERIFTRDGIDIDVPVSGKRRAVHTAVAKDNPVCFDWLIEHHANVNIPSTGSKNPLFDRARMGDNRGLRRLAHAGARAENVRSANNAKVYLLHSLSSSRGVDAEAVQTVLDLGGWVALDKPSSRGLLPVQKFRKAARGARNPQERETIDDIVDVLEAYARYPYKEPEEIASKEELFAEGSEGYALLHHPETWRRWDDVVAHLKSKGEEITKADFYRTTPDGSNWLTYSAEHIFFPTVVNHLNQQGETIGIEDLLDPETRQPNALYQTIQRNQEVSYLFQEGNWQDQGHWHYELLTRHMKPAERGRHIPNLPNFLSAGIVDSQGLLGR